MHSDRKTLPYQCCYAYLKIMTLLLKNNEVQNSVYLEMLTHAVSKYYQQEGWYAFLVTELLRFQFCSLQGIRGIVVMYFLTEQEWRSLFEVSDTTCPGVKICISVNSSASFSYLLMAKKMGRLS